MSSSRCVLPGTPRQWSNGVHYLYCGAWAAVAEEQGAGRAAPGPPASGAHLPDPTEEPRSPKLSAGRGPTLPIMCRFTHTEFKKWCFVRPDIPRDWEMRKHSRLAGGGEDAEGDKEHKVAPRDEEGAVGGPVGRTGR